MMLALLDILLPGSQPTLGYWLIGGVLVLGSLQLRRVRRPRP
jgi:hypothetical protein